MLWIVALFAGTGHAATVDAFSCAAQPDNTLRLDCQGTTSDPVRARVRYWEAGSGRADTTPWGPSQTVHDTVLWGLKGGRSYSAVLQIQDPKTMSMVNGPVVSVTTVAPTEPPFDSLILRHSVRPGATPTTPYVVIPVGCMASEALVIVDTADGEVVWYQALPDGGATVTAIAPRGQGGLLVSVDQRALYEIALDGTITRSIDFGAAGECTGGTGPCPHHEVLQAGGSTWVMTTIEDSASYDPMGLSGCPFKRRYVVDQIRRYDAAWATLDTWSLADFGYAPDVDPGPDFDPASPSPGCSGAYWQGVMGTPDAPIDWTHTNAMDIQPGPTAYLSVAQWNQVAKVDLATSSRVWTLHGMDPAYSSFDVPLAVSPSILENDDSRFRGQHHVQWHRGALWMLDNSGGSRTRALRIALDEVGMTGEITDVYTVVDDDGGSYAKPAGMRCSSRGNADPLPSGNVLSSCPGAQATMELDASDGTVAAGPVWFIEATCAFSSAWGFYRTAPLSALR